MSKIDLIKGTIAQNEKGEIGVIQSKKGSLYKGISLTHQIKVTGKGFHGQPLTYLGGTEWVSEDPQLICHTDDVLLLGEKMYKGEEVPLEIPKTDQMEGYLSFCTVDILGLVTNNNRGSTDMGDNRWPGYHLTGGTFFNKKFEGSLIDYTFSANGPWSSSKPRPIVKVKDLIRLGAQIRNWAQQELVTI